MVSVIQGPKPGFIQPHFLPITPAKQEDPEFRTLSFLEARGAPFLVGFHGKPKGKPKPFGGPILQKDTQIRLALLV